LAWLLALLSPLTLYLNEHGAEEGIGVADGFVVLKGSLSRAEGAVSIHYCMSEQRQLFQERCILAPLDVKRVFTQGFRFPSPQQQLTYW